MNYGWFEKMGEGKFKAIDGACLASECLPLVKEGRWTVMFINHKDTIEEGDAFGIRVTDSNGK